MPVDQIREIYVKRAREMFSPARIFQRFQNRYVSANLERILKSMLGEMTLGSDALQTLLLLVMRNATTDSPWPISNNPQALFNDPASPHCNLKLPLWQLVRASTAAPIYFPPEVIDIGGQRFIFVDGAVTMYNNPAFLLFLMATLEPTTYGGRRRGQTTRDLRWNGSFARSKCKSQDGPDEFPLYGRFRSVSADVFGPGGTG